MASHIIEGGPWPQGSTVTVYRRLGASPQALSAPAGQSAITTAVVAADLSTHFDGLIAEAKYWAIGQDAAGSYRWVSFTTASDPISTDGIPANRAVFWKKDLNDFDQTGATGFFWVEDLDDAALQFEVDQGENDGTATAFRMFGGKTKKTGRGTFDMFYGSCDFYGIENDEAGLFIGSITGRGVGQGNLWGGHFVLDSNQSYFGNAYGLVIQIWPPSGAKASVGGPNGLETCQAYGIQIFNPSATNVGTKAIIVTGSARWLSALDAGNCPVEKVSQLLLGSTNQVRLRPEGASDIVAELGDGSALVPVRRAEPATEAVSTGGGLALTGAFQDVPGATLNVRPPIAGTLMVRAVFDFNVTVGAVGLQCVGRCLYDGAGQTGSAIFQPADSAKGRGTVVQTWTIPVTASPSADKVLKVQAEALNLGAGAATCVQTNTKVSYHFIPNT